jgi:hypothetical protein
MKSSLHSLINFLPLFCNYHYRRLDSVQFLCSLAHILAGWSPEARLFSSDYCSSLLYIPLERERVTLRLTVGQSVSNSWCRAPSGAHDQIFSLPFDSYGLVFCGALSITRERVCLLYVLLALASAVFLGSESLGTRNHILLSQI